MRRRSKACRPLWPRVARRGLSGAVALLTLGCAMQHNAVLLPLMSAPPHASAVWQESFDALDPERWQHIKMHGATAYRVVEIDGRRCLRAESSDSASILLTEMSFDPRLSPWFSWAWRVDQFVEGEALERKSGSDASARVYVYFETPDLPWQKRNLDYVWSAVLPVGTSMRSAFSSQSHIVVVTTGTPSSGRWQTVERHLAEDYQRSFGEEPPKVIAIGVMNDTDDTRSKAVAYIDELRVSRTPSTQTNHTAAMAAPTEE